MDQATAISENLTFASGDTFILRVDFTTTLYPSGPGRDSVRIRSNKAYTTHVAVCVSRSFPSYFIYVEIPGLIFATCHRVAGGY